MGVLNATPDSFYTASRAAQVESAIHLAEDMIEEGADVLDVGGESTRPGAEPISVGSELDRVLPVIDAIHTRWPEISLSIDTQKAEVARQAIERGVDLINDISALQFDPAMADVVAESGSPVVLMHMKGSPQTMQVQPRYENVVDEVKRFFEERLTFASRHNISETRVILDPGIGFGKTLDHNMTLLKHLSEFLSLGRPLLVGVSRKSFIGAISASSGLRRLLPTGEGNPSPVGRGPSEARGEAKSILPPEDRLEGSLAAGLWAVQQGARGLRVHDVAATHRALQMWEGIQTA